jgi:hypothetical protein
MKCPIIIELLSEIQTGPPNREQKCDGGEECRQQISGDHWNTQSTKDKGKTVPVF